MKLFRRVTTGVVGVLLLLMPFTTLASSAASSMAGLYIREVEITGDEFVVLQNNDTVPIDHLSDYWLGYVGDDSSVVPPSQQLPDVALTGGQAILLNGGDSAQTCDATVTAKLSSSLSNTKGTLSLWNLDGTSFLPVESINWGNTAADALNISLDKTVVSATADPANPVWYSDGLNPWVVGDFHDCQLSNVLSQAAPPVSPPTSISWLTGTQPPVKIVSLASAASEESPANLPVSDIGLSAPQITELLPNPSGTGNDTTDEFIEIYNSNAAVFDLSGFTLETGVATKHDFVFGSGTLLPPRSFTAFYSEDTGLSLSNSGSQAQLLDPMGDVLSQTDTYSKAKDGQAWALANGEWYWTPSPTPNAENVINQAADTSIFASKTSSSKSSPSGTVKGAATSTTGDSPAAADTASNVAQVTPIHPWTLALVATVALLYGLYEYRTDVANRIYQFRKHRSARRISRG